MLNGEVGRGECWMGSGGVETPPGVAFRCILVHPAVRLYGRGMRKVSENVQKCPVTRSDSMGRRAHISRRVGSSTSPWRVAKPWRGGGGGRCSKGLSPGSVAMGRSVAKNE